MTIAQRCLAVLIICELVVGCVLVVRRYQRPIPPSPTLKWLDPETTAKLRTLRSGLWNAEDWTQLAEAYATIGHLPAAEACYGHATELAPKSAHVAYAWGRCLEDLGRTNEAIDQFRRAVVLGYGDQDDCYYQIGKCYLRQENPDESERAFSQAAGHLEATCQLAKLLARSDRPQEAIPLLDRLIRAHPKILEPYHWRARAESALGNLAAAAEFREKSEFAHTSILGPDVRPIRQSIHDLYGHERFFEAGMARLQEGEVSEASRKLHASLQDRWGVEAFEALLQIKLDGGQLSEAMRLVDEEIAREGPSPGALELLGDVLYAKGESERPRDLWIRATKLRATKFNHGRLEDYYRQHSEPDLAQRHGALAVQREGIERLRTGDFQNAAKQLKSSLKSAPEQAVTWFYLAEAYRHLGNHESESSTAYRRCLEMDPNHGRAQTGLRRLATTQSMREP